MMSKRDETNMLSLSHAAVCKCNIIYGSISEVVLQVPGEGNAPPPQNFFLSFITFLIGHV